MVPCCQWSEQHSGAGNSQRGTPCPHHDASACTDRPVHSRLSALAPSPCCPGSSDLLCRDAQFAEAADDVEAQPLQKTIFHFYGASAKICSLCESLLPLQMTSPSANLISLCILRTSTRNQPELACTVCTSHMPPLDKSDICC